ncbi:FtsK/SpoIIIE domain-containing protein [Actinomycetospora soli]|uniref:FtsK/SpoIIIE domain-containing protein n=1 Tax=Actinomycetospora soli TaxID=2893887 RepID=UPI001E573311|nr:FtsK/SpoIIIE domain-containing protein [Actinomycetospora soli]MCD2191652.1 hypothetical protein [Actinomycetospora soli]
MALFPVRWPLFGRHATRYAREVPDQRRRTVEQEFRALWRATAEGCGLARVVHVAAGVTVSVPRLGGVQVDGDGRVRRITVQRHPGQRTADYRERASQLADALGVARVRIDDLAADRWIAVTLLEVDPLADSRAWSVRIPDGFIAETEDGRLFSAPWEQRPHAVVQGTTGSGKSWWLYAQLAALAARPVCPFTDRPAVLVTGIDPSGVLWRPWTGLPAARWRVSGLAGDLTEHRRVLAELCAEMDRRLELLPADRDVLATDGDTPLLVVVLEEYAALIRTAELIDRKVGAEVRSRVGRLLAEGRKVGLRVVVVLQRADAATFDGAMRAQATLRISFASEADGIAMLHPRSAVDPDEHAVAAPGVAVLTAPRVGTLRVRSRRLDYAGYVAAVTATAGRAA